MQEQTDLSVRWDVYIIALVTINNYGAIIFLDKCQVTVVVIL